MPVVLQVILWMVGGVVGLIVLYLAFVVAGTVYTLAVGNKPQGVEVEVEAPVTCNLGDDASVVVRIRDTLGRERRLWSVDLDASYLSGLVVKKIDPAPADRNAQPLLGTYVHRMDRPLAANSTEVVTFSLHAAKAGDFAGDVTVYVDSNSFRYIATPIRTIVRAQFWQELDAVHGY